jgi:pullulanase
VHVAADAGDKRAAQALFDAVAGTVTIPARTAVVFVAN